MDRTRRVLLSAGGLAAAATPLAVAVGAADAATPRRLGSQRPFNGNMSVTEFDVFPNIPADQTAALQKALDRAAARKAVLTLPPGHYLTRPLTLRPGSHIAGCGPQTRLIQIGIGPVLSARVAHRVTVEDMTLDGAMRPLGDTAGGVLKLEAVAQVTLNRLHITQSSFNGISLIGCGGTVRDVRIDEVAQTGLFALDGNRLLVEACTVETCANNGIQIWQSAPREDGSLVINNRIAKIRTDDGGSGQNGNGINVFRAGNVTVQGNHITDCAYSAVRGNSASNMTIIGNQGHRLGEVALYAEFAFQGAVIAQNLIDDAATGISVTNFNDGGRLATIQGNVVRNLKRREFEPVDQRGTGIAAEADSAITGNVVEGAPSSGIWVGMREYMRNVVVNGNIVRASRYGVAISGNAQAGMGMISNNVFSDIRSGAVRLVDGYDAYGQDLGSGFSNARLNVTGNMVS